MSDQILDNASAGKGERPTFLTVLCILTFIGSGLGVLGGLMGLAGSQMLARFAPVGDLMIVTLIGLVAAGLCLFGAIQMWGLKKMGFTLYVAGSGISIIMSIVNVLSMGNLGPFAGAIWTGLFIGIGINVAFILMYNANRSALVN